MNRLFQPYNGFILQHVLFNTLTPAECDLDMRKYVIPEKVPLILVSLHRIITRSKQKSKPETRMHRSKSFKQQEKKKTSCLSFCSLAKEFAILKRNS